MEATSLQSDARHALQVHQECEECFGGMCNGRIVGMRGNLRGGTFLRPLFFTWQSGQTRGSTPTWPFQQCRKCSAKVRAVLYNPAMPLLDHFNPPLYPARHWEAFHGRWAAAISDALNAVLPKGYFAEMQ